MIIRKAYELFVLPKRRIASSSKWWLNRYCLEELEKFGLKKFDVIKYRNKLPKNFDYIKESLEILEESGIPPSVQKVIDFRDYYTVKNVEKMIMFKEMLPDLTSRYLSYLEEFPYDRNARMPSLQGIAEAYRPVPQYYRYNRGDSDTYSDWPNNVEEEQKSTLQIAQRQILRQYYAWRLISDLYTIDTNIYNYSKVTGIRSLRTIKATLDILTNDLRLRNRIILANFYLLSLTPHRLRTFICKIKKIGRYELKDAVVLAPKILAKPWEEILEVDNIFKEFGVADESSKFRVQILTLKAATIRKRLQLIAEDPEMSPFLKHPRISQLIYYYNKAKLRMEEAKMADVRFISLNVLTGNDHCFQRFITGGFDQVRHHFDICYFLASEFDVPKSLIAGMLKLHPSFPTSAINDVCETYYYLLDKDFPKDVILESVHLLLYPKDKIEEELEHIAEDEKLKVLGFNNGFVSNVTAEFPQRTKFKDKRLILCLYFLEKHHHFTGAGTTRTT